MRSPMILAMTALLFATSREAEGADPQVAPGTKAEVPAAKSQTPAPAKPAAENPDKPPAVQTPPANAPAPKPKVVLPAFKTPAPASESSEEAEYRRKARDAEDKRVRQEASKMGTLTPAAMPARSASKPSAREESEGPIDPDNPGGPQVDPNNPGGPQKKSPPQ
jgi:hypothetical protein